MALRERIEDLVNRYSLAYDTSDLDEMGRIFSDDAVFRMRLPEADPVEFAGKAAIMELMAGAMGSQNDQRRHLNSNLIVHPGQGDEIATTHYLTLVGTADGEISLITAGVYRLRIVDRDGVLVLRELDLELDRPY